MTDLTTWDRWSPVVIPDPETVGFENTGDTATFVYSPFGIPIRGTMRALEVRPTELWSVRFEQPSFPDVDLTLVFKNSGAHAFTVDVTVQTHDAEWWNKAYEWISTMPFVIKRDIRHALDALHGTFVHPATVESATG